ncbi:hypothetical protein ACFO4E_26980 [Nocardiopsis mangrovi]|uniref:Uncharacterized protein n=1 Tax=Nocardiopsis mangrovi TaxID=1179818 RepID=A0ABV9E3L2_9ACTN
MDDLPPRRPFVRQKVPGGHLIVIRRGIEYGDLHRAYTRKLVPTARRALYHAVFTPDPVDDPEGFAAAQWWPDDDELPYSLVQDLIALGRMHRYGAG